jgi:membrane protease YdiL (CAAX protease family)
MASLDASWPIDPWRDGSDPPEGSTLGREETEEEPRGHFPDSAWARIRAGWPGAAWVDNPKLRRFQGSELLIVLAIFPLGAILSALIVLIQQLQAHQSIANSSTAPISGVWLPAALGALAYMTQLAAPALVFYLLTRSREGIESINLGGRRWRMDLALLLPVFIVVWFIPQNVGNHLLSALHIHGFLAAPGSGAAIPSAPLMATMVAMAVTAGIVEEIVVLGYLVRRLEQRGYSATTIVLIAVGVRVAYHLYYGWDVLPIVLWAFASVVVYLRIRRLFPFIVCHVMWDIGVPLKALYPGFYSSMAVVAFLAAVVAMAMWIRWIPDEDRRQLAAQAVPEVNTAWLATPSGWYPDPALHYEWRYWDGRGWTAHVSSSGTIRSDPIS